ncbi:MAG: hypothetical protein RR995_03895 [Hungatella sp.]
MEYEAEVYLLSQKFTKDYPISTYPELMCKSGRPYTCLLIDSHECYFICVPFRSSIGHKNSFMFQGTQRSKKNKSGLDYSKMVLISDDDYIDANVKAIVDQDEYTEMMRNLPYIVTDVLQYVDIYINHVNGTNGIHPREYDRKYLYSTLPYFHDIMNLQKQ